MSLHRSLLEKPRSQEPFGVNSEVFVQKGCDQALFGIVSELFLFQKGSDQTLFSGCDGFMDRDGAADCSVLLWSHPCSGHLCTTTRISRPNLAPIHTLLSLKLPHKGSVL